MMLSAIFIYFIRLIALAVGGIAFGYVLGILKEKYE